MKNLKNILVVIIIAQFLACVKSSDLDASNVVDNDTTTGSDSDDPLSEFNVTADFNYSTSKEVAITLDAPDFLKSAVFSVYSKTGNEDSLAIGKASFDANGHFKKTFPLTQRADSILLFSNYLGLTKELRLAIENNEVVFDYRPLYERVSTSGKEKIQPKSIGFSSISGKASFTYLDTYNNLGVPDNLVFPDVIQQNLLDDVNASLPEYVAGGIPVSNPEYLAGAETRIVLKKEADVWVTFVAEGAGYRNGLGYYSYPIGQEPVSSTDISQHNIIFPNVSMVGSGGGLIPGDRVYLGKFPANTVISWFLVANGWNGANVSNGNGIYYSNPDFNPESNSDKKTHMVLLNDQSRDLTILGFEDLNREGGSDDDFNDAVFYAKTNPIDAIQIEGVAQIEAANDSDGDGINDELDDFPFDVNKAFNNFAPSANSSGKLAYEDLWPNKGDYDFNDLVVEYSFNLIANADNLVTAIEGNFTIEEIGASFHNGFAFVLPISPSLVQNIEGQILNGGYEAVATNGCETGTGSNEAVIIVAGDTFSMTGQTVNLSLTFNEPIDEALLGDIPFNAFLIVNGDRAREVHLPDSPPTSKADYLGTKDDYSNNDAGRFFKTNKNLPWALNLYEGFVPPPESVRIDIQYPKFVNWANSGGTEDIDWYIR